MSKMIIDMKHNKQNVEIRVTLHMKNQYGFEQDDIYPLHCTSIAAGRRIVEEGLIPGGRRWGNNRLAVHFSVRCPSQMPPGQRCGAHTHTQRRVDIPRLA